MCEGIYVRYMRPKQIIGTHQEMAMIVVVTLTIMMIGTITNHHRFNPTQPFFYIHIINTKKTTYS